jgi:hypothetical protein
MMSLWQRAAVAAKAANASAEWSVQPVDELTSGCSKVVQAVVHSLAAAPVTHSAPVIRRRSSKSALSTAADRELAAPAPWASAFLSQAHLRAIGAAYVQQAGNNINSSGSAPGVDTPSAPQIAECIGLFSDADPEAALAQVALALAAPSAVAASPHPTQTIGIVCRSARAARDLTFALQVRRLYFIVVSTVIGEIVATQDAIAHAPASDHHRFSNVAIACNHALRLADVAEVRLLLAALGALVCAAFRIPLTSQSILSFSQTQPNEVRHLYQLCGSPLYSARLSRHLGSTVSEAALAKVLQVRASVNKPDRYHHVE